MESKRCSNCGSTTAFIHINVHGPYKQRSKTENHFLCRVCAAKHSEGKYHCICCKNPLTKETRHAIKMCDSCTRDYKINQIVDESS